MFLSVRKGLWFGSLGILILLLLGIASCTGFGWAWGIKSSKHWRQRKNVLLYGTPDGRPSRQTLLHKLGDVWNFFFR